ncbi:MAG TPA: tRNA(His) guanylyltransferase Thg1 family protein [Polyangiaceae bacterium]|nr:tRNA(His) guanylyltransferase Thg1 family protein [Polyangiaceae bacterium]
MAENDDLEARMRALEWFHALRVVPATWPVIRVDGRGFTRLVEQYFDRPFDVRFHQIMVQTARTLLQELHGVYAFTESDEISVVLHPDTDLFHRELEKLVSISAGVASATFSLELGKPAHFDGRVWMGPRLEHVVDYLRWRQSDAARCALNTWCYWSLRKEGQTYEQVTATLTGKNFSDKNELLFARGINFNDVPLWQKHGVGVYPKRIEKQGLNPMTGEVTLAQRRQVVVDTELPRGDAYAEFITQLLQSATRSA